MMHIYKTIRGCGVSSRTLTGALCGLSILGLLCALSVHAQQDPQTQVKETIVGRQPSHTVGNGTTSIPRLIRFSDILRPANGLPISPVESITLSIYREESGGAPVWQETQNVDVDAEGKYTVLMGATLQDGVPVDLFTSNDPLWLGVQFNRTREVEQPRRRLSSVPYALKAVDAETLGGRPASAYMLAGAAPTGAVSDSATVGEATAKIATPTPKSVCNGTCTWGYVAAFADASANLGNSSMFQAGANIGIGTTSPTRKVSLYDTFTPYFSFNDSGGERTVIGSEVTSGRRFMVYDANSNQYRLALDNSGNLGIGTSLPLAALHVEATSGNVSALARTEQATAPAASYKLQLGGLTNSPVANMQFYAPTGAGSEYLRWNLINSSGATLADILTINRLGNVGIGTASPSYKLDVSGDINFSGVFRYQGDPLIAFGGNPPAAGSTAFGVGAFNSTAFGTGNTAFGYKALPSASSASVNVAVGQFALTALTSGSGNTAVGNGALKNAISGLSNIAIGNFAGYNVTSGNNNIDIGHLGVTSDSGVIRIGTSGTQSAFYVAGVTGVTTSNSAVPVLIDTTTGQLGVTSSSRRYKEDIQDMGGASDDLMRLRPVTYRYQKAFADGSKPIQYGLIAEEVAEVYPDLVAHTADGQVETVKYQVLDSMLLNEVQKQQAHIRMLEERLAKLEAANRPK